MLFTHENQLIQRLPDFPQESIRVPDPLFCFSIRGRMGKFLSCSRGEISLSPSPMVFCALCQVRRLRDLVRPGCRSLLGRGTTSLTVQGRSRNVAGESKFV